MAGLGPIPNQQHQRERDTRRRQADSVTVTRDDVVRGPELRPGYGPETLAWYQTWRTSPQAQLFEATDWSRLALLAPIVDAHWSRATPSALAEIRLNEERLGATYVDRLRARMKIEAAGPAASVTPIHAVSRRAALTDRLTAATSAGAASADDDSDNALPF
jgi:hypothetical protein